jgi:hypothetical protein
MPGADATVTGRAVEGRGGPMSTLRSRVGDNEDGQDDAEPGTLTREQLGGGPDLRAMVMDHLGPVVLVAAALLMAGFVLGRVTAPDGPTTGAGSPEAAPPATFPPGDVDRTGYWSFGGVVAEIADPFDRADNPTALGTTPSGERWDSAGGTWGIDGNQAFAEANDTDTPAIAVLSGGSPMRLTEATLMVVEEGAGIVFRYRDDQNFWSVTAQPDDGSWLVLQVVDGNARARAEIDGPTDDGTTVSVADRASTLQVFIEGQAAPPIEAEATRTVPTSGLVAAPGSTGTARWDRFFVGALGTGG